MTDQATCHVCRTHLTWDSSVFYNITGPVALNGPDTVIVKLNASYAVVCEECAELIARRAVQGMLGRAPIEWASDAIRSEAAALALKFLDAIGPPLEFGDWWLQRHG